MIVIANPGIDTDVVIKTEPGETRDSAWITFDTGLVQYSINIIKTDEGIVIDVYPLNLEMDCQPLGSTYVSEQDVLDEVEGLQP